MAATSQPKAECWSPIPMRAACDQRLTSHQLRTLIAVAGHDRFNKNGVGCFASQKRLTEILGGDHTRVNKSLSDLVAMGYLDMAINPVNRRLRVFRVIYSDDDLQVMKAREGWRASQSFIGMKDGPFANHQGPIVGREKSQAHDIVAEPVTNIFSEAVDNRFCEAATPATKEVAASAQKQGALEREPSQAEVADVIGVALDKRKRVIWTDTDAEAYLTSVGEMVDTPELLQGETAALVQITSAKNLNPVHVERAGSLLSTIMWGRP